MASFNFKRSVYEPLKLDTEVDPSRFRDIPKGSLGVTDRKLPRSPLDFEVYKPIAEKVLRGVERYGPDHIPSDLPSPFKEHYILFKVSLDLWEQIPIKKAISKLDLIKGCLQNGPAFAEWLKKARFYSFAWKTSEGAHDIPEEYVLPDYRGYDSIFRETELIHWKEETSDFQYAFIPVGEIREESLFKSTFKELLEEVLPKCKFPETISTLDWIKATRGFDPSTGKNLCTRDTMRNLKKIGQGWYGKRTIIRPFPGGIRDTVIPDPDTLAKIKLCGNIFKEILEHTPESGMSSRLDSRFERVISRKLFTHLDLKKAGLTFPRRLFILLAEVLDEYGFETWFIKDIESIYVDVEGDVFSTKRGFCLGWMNEALTLAIIVLLRAMRKSYGLSFDFIVYNDDLVIGDQDQDSETYLELFRFACKEFFNSFQIFLSEKKCFSSRAVQFLEEYRYQEDYYNLDMEKRQVATALFAKSLCSHYIWKAKMYASVAFEIYPNESMLWECIARGRETTKVPEKDLPYIAGGWYTPIVNGLDNSLENERDLKWIIALGEVRLPKFAEKIKPFNAKSAFDAKHKRIFFSSARYELGEDAREFLAEQSDFALSGLIKTRLEQYRGSKKTFPCALGERVSKMLSSKFWEPP